MKIMQIFNFGSKKQSAVTSQVSARKALSSIERELFKKCGIDLKGASVEQDDKSKTILNKVGEKIGIIGFLNTNNFHALTVFRKGVIDAKGEVGENTIKVIGYNPTKPKSPIISIGDGIKKKDGSFVEYSCIEFAENGNVKKLSINKPRELEIEYGPKMEIKRWVAKNGKKWQSIRGMQPDGRYIYEKKKIPFWLLTDKEAVELARKNWFTAK